MSVSYIGRAGGALTVMILVMTACSNTSESSAGASDTLTIAVWGVNEDIESIQEAAKGFEERNPDIDLRFNTTDCGADYSVCKTLIAGGNMADVIVAGSWNYNEMINDDVLADITDRMEADGIDPADFTSVVIDSNRAARDGQFYGLPMGYNVQSLFYNTEMFAAAGLDEPPADGSYTYEDLREWSRALTLDDEGRNADDPSFDPARIEQWGYYNRIAIPSEPGYLPVLWSHGGGLLGGEERSRCELEEPGSIEALQLLQDMMWEDHSAVTPQMEQEMPGYLRWVEGSVAMQQGSHEQVNIVEQQNPELEYDMAALPAGPAGNSTLIQVHTWAVYENSSNQDGAWEFIKYMATDGAGEQMGLIPAYQDVAYGPSFLEAPGEPDNLAAAQLEPAEWDLARTNVDPLGVMAMVVGQDGMAPALEAIITNSAPAAEALAGVCARVDDIVSSR